MSTLLAQLAGQSNEAIGLRVRIRREMLHLEPEAVYTALGMGPQTYGRLERGARNVTAQEASRLCDVLACSIHYLLDTPDAQGNGAAEYLLLMYWRALPETPGVDWTREGLLDTLRKTVLRG